MKGKMIKRGGVPPEATASIVVELPEHLHQLCQEIVTFTPDLSMDQFIQAAIVSYVMEKGGSSAIMFAARTGYLKWMMGYGK